MTEHLQPIFLTNDDQRRSIAPGDAIDALRDGLKSLATGDAIRRPRIDNYIPLRNDAVFAFSSMEGGIRNGYYALRIKPDVMSFSWNGNVARSQTYCGEPGKYGGLVLLFSVRSGALVAIMNDGYVQHLRVAASAALGAQYLSRPDATTLGIVGSGWMARTIPLAISEVRNLTSIQVYSPNPEHLRAYCAQMNDLTDIEIRPVQSASSAVEGADIVCTCTTSLEPVISAEDIAPGTHLNYVRPWELGDDIRAIVDTEGILLDAQPLLAGGFQDFNFGIRMGALSYAVGTADELSQIPYGSAPTAFPNAQLVKCIDWSTGRAYERRDANEITILATHSYGVRPGDAPSSAGTQGVQFAAVAGRLYDNARARGIGSPIGSNQWLQEIPT